MKIENENFSWKEFGELKEGEVFSYVGYLFIKTDTIHKNKVNSFGQIENLTEYNCVDLKTGNHELFDEITSVIPLPNAVLKIS